MKLLLLDRDGVINEDSDDFIKSVDEWIPIPSSLEAIALANRLGFTVSVISNQSGIARGLFTVSDLTEIHNEMNRRLARFGGRIEAFFFCPHGPQDNCECRKPKPGLLYAAGRRHHVGLSQVFFIGDRQSDLDAARAAGAKPVLVRTGHGAALAEELKAQGDETPIFTNLMNAVRGIRAL